MGHWPLRPPRPPTAKSTGTTRSINKAIWTLPTLFTSPERQRQVVTWDNYGSQSDWYVCIYEAPKLAKSLTLPRALSRQLRRLRRPRRRDYTLLPRLLLGLLHATHTPRLSRRRALAPEVLHLGGEYRVPQDPGESPCRRGPARGGQQGLLLHQGEVVLLQQQVPEIHPPS